MASIVLFFLIMRVVATDKKSPVLLCSDHLPFHVKTQQINELGKYFETGTKMDGM